MMKSNSTRTNNLDAIREWAIGEYILDEESIHGPEHWDKVLKNGTMLAERTSGADILVVELFSLVHDCQRRTDSYDPDHGRRAAKALREITGILIHLSKKQQILLEKACRGHADGKISSDPTIGCCWDADRLELPRAGIKMIPRFFSTGTARKMVESEYESHTF